MDTTITSAQTKQLKFSNKEYFQSSSHTKILVTIDMLKILKIFSWKPTHRGNTVKIKVAQEKKINPTCYLLILDKEDYMEKEILLLIFTEKWFPVT